MLYKSIILNVLKNIFFIAINCQNHNIKVNTETFLISQWNGDFSIVERNNDI